MPKARKTSEIPTKIYSYGCLPPKEGFDLMQAQLRMKTDYWNALVVIEHERRSAILAAQRGMPDIEPLAAKVDALGEAIEEAYKALKDKKTGKGKSADTAFEALRVKTLKQEQKDARIVLRQAKDAYKEDKDLLAKYEAINAAAHAKVIASRAEFSTKGFYWGTYNAVEAAFDQAKKDSKTRPGKKPVPWDRKPFFERYDGSGRCVVQIQKGISVQELHACTDTQLQLDPVPPGTFSQTRHKRRLMSRTTARIRVCSDDKRRPKWLVLPIIYHRPLPPDARIMGAWLLRRRIGLNFEYRLQIVCESREFISPADNGGTSRVAVDLGWRNLHNESVRVAYWRDDEGNHGQLLLPQKVIYGLVKVDELRSIRDKIFDETKALLKRWFDEHPRDGEPRQIDERLDRARQYLSRWRDQKKLSMLVKGWIKEERSEEHELLVTLAAWEKQDRHLLFWQSQQRDRRIGLRRETFKVFAATMARKYAEIVVEGDFHLPDVREQTPAEDGVPSDGKAQRRTADIAAPGELREYLKRAAEKYGATFTKIKAAYSTQIDNPDGGGCGAVSELNASSDVFVTCSLCGHLFDQDDNACRNLLAFARKGRIAA